MFYYHSLLVLCVCVLLTSHVACLISVLIYVSAVLICVEDGLGTPVSIGAASGAVYTVHDVYVYMHTAKK